MPNDVIDVLMYHPQMFSALIEHVTMSFLSVFLAVVIAVPLGILFSRHHDLARPVIYLLSLLQSIPGMALLSFVAVTVGSGYIILLLTIYAIMPLLRHTYNGLANIDNGLVCTGVGIGMKPLQLLYMVELPLAAPAIIAGLRRAFVRVIGLAALAPLLGGNGLGGLIIEGLATNDVNLILAGAIPLSILALLIEFSLRIIQRLVNPYKK